MPLYHDPQNPEFFEMQTTLAKLLEYKRSDLAADCVQRILSRALNLPRHDRRYAAEEAQAAVGKLQEAAGDRCTRPMYLAVARLSRQAGQAIEAREALTELERLNNEHVVEAGGKPGKKEPPTPGRVLELIERAQLEKVTGRGRQASILAKRALSASWGLDLRLQASAAAHFCNIEAARGHQGVAEGLAVLRDQLMEAMPPEPLSVFDPALWT